MKKLLVLLLVISLSGCAMIDDYLTGGNEEEVVDETEEVVEEKFSVWAIKPGIDIDNIKVMLPFDKKEIATNSGRALIDIEKIGYPQQWHDYDYDTNAIIIAKEGNHGIYTYEMEMLYPISVSIHSAPFASGIAPARINEDGNIKCVYGTANTAISTAFAFDSDYISVRDIKFENYEYDPYGKTKYFPYIAVKDEVIGIVTPHEDGSNTFEEYSPNVGKDYIAPIVDNGFHITGYYIINSDGTVRFPTIKDYGGYVEGSFINGFYVAGSKNDKALINAESSTQVGLVYQDVLYYSDGYCPVKKYGKWGYIDEEGNEVTDFIFDGVTSLYDGKAFVLGFGKYGVLDFKKAFDNGASLTVQSMYNEDNEEPSLGTAEVLISELTIRAGAGTAYNSFGNSHVGAKYKVYEIVDADGYRWYRVANSLWLPDTKGEWVSFNES